jgi:hypothetical protein
MNNDKIKKLKKVLEVRKEATDLLNKNQILFDLADADLLDDVVKSMIQFKYGKNK